MCKTSQSIHTPSFSSTSIYKKCEIRYFITCQRCTCRLQYVGRATWELNVRICEHLNNIRKGHPSHSVSQIFDTFRKRDPSLPVVGIEKYSPHCRGGNLKRHIFHHETQWIHDLRCYHPLGLNIEWDVNSFINNS